MIEITWKDADALNWRDFIPESVLNDPAFDGPLFHEVRDPSGERHKALCTVSRHAAGVDLTYEQVDPNTTWECYSGTTRISVEDGLAVEWRDPDDTAFSPIAAIIRRVVDDASEARLSAPAAVVEELTHSEELGSIATERLAEAIVRVGQGKFRKGLEERWGCCALTGLTTSALLRASHIHPWSVCSEDEKVDIDNGLLLAAHVDALFDRHLLSFGDDGRLMWSERMPDDQRVALGLPREKVEVGFTDKTKRYLERHRGVMNELDRAARLHP